ncbi:MAG TPA: type II secretion system protein GspM [bacterium]|nr:type II secretion system protein GspM [bacterium]
MVLSDREKLLIGLLVALLVAMGLFFGVKGLRGRIADLRSRVEVREALLQKAAAVTGELRHLQQAATRQRPVRNRSLISYVEQLADGVGLRDRIQLNALPQDTNAGLQGVDVKVERLTLDEMVNLLYTLENADYRLIIAQFDLSPSFRDKDLLRLSMRVLARQ